MKHWRAWLVLLLGICAVTWLAASPVITNQTNETVAWSGPAGVRDSITIAPAWKRSPTEIEWIYVANVAGGTATNAWVEVHRYNGHYSGADTTQDTMVVFRTRVPGGPAAAPALGYFLAPVGGLYRSNPGDTLRVWANMTGATSLYVACKYHEGR